MDLDTLRKRNLLECVNEYFCKLTSLDSLTFNQIECITQMLHEMEDDEMNVRLFLKGKSNILGMSLYVNHNGEYDGVFLSKDFEFYDTITKELTPGDLFSEILEVMVSTGRLEMYEQLAGHPYQPPSFEEDKEYVTPPSAPLRDEPAYKPLSKDTSGDALAKSLSKDATPPRDEPAHKPLSKDTSGDALACGLLPKRSAVLSDALLFDRSKQLQEVLMVV
jgi:cell wall assembly regulator SMI1